MDSKFIPLEEFLPIGEFKDADLGLEGYRHPKDLTNLMITFDVSKPFDHPGFILYRRCKEKSKSDMDQILWVDYRCQPFYTKIIPVVPVVIIDPKLEKVNKLKANERICETHNWDQWQPRNKKKKNRSKVRRTRHNRKKWHNRNFKQESMQKHRSQFHPDESDQIEYSTWCENCDHEFIHYHPDGHEFSSSCYGCQAQPLHKTICYRINKCRFCKSIYCDCFAKSTYYYSSDDDYYY